MKTFFLIKWNISLVLLAGITTFYACKSDDRELQGEPVPQVQKPNDISEINLEKDVKLKVSGGRDTDHQPGQDISKSYDGQFGGTCYHSTWNQSAKFPVTLEYQFDQNKLTLDYILYHSRNGNGNFGAFELYIKPQGSTDFVHIQDYDFKGAGGSHRILLKDSIVPAEVQSKEKSE